MDKKTSLSTISYSVYFLGAIVLSYCMQWVTVLFVGSMRFTAADSYPGDLSTSELITWSVAFPVMHFIVLTICLSLHRLLTSAFGIPFRKRIPFIFNIAITLCLIGYLLYVFLSSE